MLQGYSDVFFDCYELFNLVLVVTEGLSHVFKGKGLDHYVLGSNEEASHGDQLEVVCWDGAVLGGDVLIHHFHCLED